METGTTSDSGRFRLGTHEADIRNLKQQLTEHKRETNEHLIKQDEKLDKILATLNRAKGSWRTLLAIGTAMGVLVEGLHELVTWMHK